MKKAETQKGSSEGTRKDPEVSLETKTNFIHTIVNLYGCVTGIVKETDEPLVVTLARI